MSKLRKKLTNIRYVTNEMSLSDFRTRNWPFPNRLIYLLLYQLELVLRQVKHRQSQTTVDMCIKLKKQIVTRSYFIGTCYT